MDKENQTNSEKKEYIDNKAIYAPIPEDVPEKKQTSCRIEWTGNPGSKPTKDYVSMKAMVCPDAQWVGTDVHEFVPTAEIGKNNITAMFTVPDGRIGVNIFRVRDVKAHALTDFLTGFNDIAFSSDGGRTWTDPVRLNLPDPMLLPDIQNTVSDHLVVNTVMPDGEGNMMIFATIRTDNNQCTSVLLCRTKDFVTFTPWKHTFEKKGYFVINNDRIIRLKSGRILIPTALHGFDDYRITGGKTSFFYSDDNGETWLESTTVSAFPSEAGQRNGLQETGVCELADGTVWALARTAVGCHYQQFSTDGGETWSVPGPSVFLGPLSPLTMKRASDGRLVTVWNPIPGLRNEIVGGGWSIRTPIVIAASADEGQTWTRYRVMDDAVEGNYCYPTIYADGEGYLLVSYYYTELGNPTSMAQSKIKRIELSDL